MNRQRGNVVNGLSGGQKGVAAKTFAVPFAMLATFLLFNVTDTVLTATFFVNDGLTENTYDLICNTTFLLVMAGILSDFLIYIFLQKEV